MKKSKWNKGKVVRKDELPTINYVGLEDRNMYQNVGILGISKLSEIGIDYNYICNTPRMSRNWFKLPIPDEFEVFFLYGHQPTNCFYMFYGYRIRVDYFDVNVLIEVRERREGRYSREEVRQKLIKCLAEKGYKTEIIGDREFISVRRGRT